MIGLVALALAGGGVVDAERAFAAMAQRDGQWTAFRAYAAPDAVMFVPGKVSAQDWLQGRADPQQSVKWWPGRVVVSCDNTLALSTGAWRRPDGSTGVFTTIWRRDGDGWHWILDQGHDTPKPVATPEPAQVLRASCKGLPAPAIGRASGGHFNPRTFLVLVDDAMPGDMTSLGAGGVMSHATTAGASKDGSLRWWLGPAMAPLAVENERGEGPHIGRDTRLLAVTRWIGAGYEPVLFDITGVTP